MEVFSWENHLFLRVIYTMAMLNNQSLEMFTDLGIHHGISAAPHC